MHSVLLLLLGSGRTMPQEVPAIRAFCNCRGALQHGLVCHSPPNHLIACAHWCHNAVAEATYSAATASVISVVGASSAGTCMASASLCNLPIAQAVLQAERAYEVVHSTCSNHASVPGLVDSTLQVPYAPEFVMQKQIHAASALLRA